MPPTGFKRSRALWDRTRFSHASRYDQVMSFVTAMAYELQPIRASSCHGMLDSIDVYKNELLSQISVLLQLVGKTNNKDNGKMEIGKVLKQQLQECWLSLNSFFKTTLWSFLKNRSRREWLMLGGVIVYYYFVKWLHDILHAGPIVIIVTALVLIFTVGLGDNDKARKDDPNYMSAYSVFNRGLERMLGTVDAEELLAQHVGGGGAAAMLMGGGGGGFEEEPGRLGRGGGGGAAAIAARRPAAEEEESENDDEYDDDNDDSVGENDNNDNNRAAARRLTNKKARGRQRNRQQRQEMRLQREAVRAMGFDDNNDEINQVAMQRLLEEQIAAAAAAR